MIRVFLTEAELGCMVDFNNNYITATKAKDRNFAERALVSFLLGFHRMRNNGVVPEGAGFKIENVTKTYMAYTLQTDYVFQLSNVEDRIRFNAERIAHAESLESL